MIGVRCRAITQVKQLFAGSVLGWVTAGPRPAHRNVEREVIFQRLLDWGQTLLNGRLYRHRFSAVSLCPHVNAIQYAREWLRSHSHGDTSSGKDGRDGYKEGKAEERGKGWGICIRQVAIQAETRKQKHILFIVTKISLIIVQGVSREVAETNR